jgi:hypothetical protein
MRNTTMMWTGTAALLLAHATACNDDPTGLASADAQFSAAAANKTMYDQVEFLGNPLVSEVTVTKANHDAYNRMQPYATATFRPQTEQFIVQVGGRPAAYAQTVAGVHYPDLLVVDASKPTSSAGWLSWALAAGWGGRKPTDDVVDVGLSAIFSSLLSPTGASCAPFTLPLCTDNVGANDRPFSSTFPYLAAPNA